jgi:hypothetical protein
MKRQHPTDPNLFWCPKCRGYKEREEFGKHKGQPYGIGGHCLQCRQATEKSKKSIRARRGICPVCNGEFTAAVAKKYCTQRCAKKGWKPDPKKIKEKRGTTKYKTRSNSLQRKLRDGLPDWYVVDRLRKGGHQVTPETIELKRQQIIMKRTLKEFKQWRKENEK